MRLRITSLAGIALLTSTGLWADFQYEQTTRVTGGFIASMGRFAGRVTDPQTSSVFLKGNRMAHVSPKTASIIDLDKETITNVDFEKKTYSVMTFQQMRQALEEAMQNMNKEGAKSAELRFDAAVKESGQTKVVNGLNTKEFILTMTMTGTDQKSGQSGAMNITNDMWMASSIPGYEEVKRFYERMGQKLGTTFEGMNPAGMMRPQMGKGLAEMAKEMAKLKGVPVMQVTRMGATPDGKPLPAASEAPELSKGPELPSAGDVAGRAAGSAAAGAAESRMGRLGGLAGGLGGLGGIGRRKRDQQQEQPQNDQQQQQQQQQRAAAGGGLLMETTTEMSNFSSAPVDGSKLDVPSGFKQVESEMLKRRGR